MSAIQRYARTAVLACALLVTSAANAATYTELYVFGDSLLDPGNAAALTPTGGPVAFFPPTPSGRFSNGPVAAEYLAATLGVTVARGWPDATGANNFAVGGALAGNGNFNVAINSPAGLATTPAYATVGVTGIAQQIARFDPGPFDAGSALFLLWGGPNDIFLATAVGGDLADAGAAAIANLVGNVLALVNKGAKNIVVPFLPDLGLTPAFVGTPGQFPATFLTGQFNTGLAAGLASIDPLLDAKGVNVFTFDIAEYLRSIVAGAAFQNKTEACVGGLCLLGAAARRRAAQV